MLGRPPASLARRRYLSKEDESGFMKHSGTVSAICTADPEDGDLKNLEDNVNPDFEKRRRESLDAGQVGEGGRARGWEMRV